MPSTGLRLVMPLCAGLAGGLLPEAARAQSADTSQLEEVVVTAQKTGSTVQKTPISMTALTSADLDKSLTQSIKDLGTSVPNVSIGQTTAYAMIYIRGIGTNNVGNGSDPDVTVQLDGIYLARPVELFNDFTDVERVEVLRGPQGTLYGRNAVGGTINIISKTPSDKFSATEALTYGNYNTVQEQAYVTGPIVPDKLQFSVAFNYLHHDPYLKNLDPAGNDLQNANHGGIHGQLQWEPSANVTATTRFDWMLLGENPASFSVPNGSIPEAPLANSLVGAKNFKVAQNTPDYQSEAGGGISEDINATINQHWSLRSLTAFRENHLHQAFDGDNTEIAASTFNQTDKENQATQEFDLNWRYNRFKGVTGVYYFREYISTFINQSLAPAAGYPGSPPAALSFQATPVTNADAGAAFCTTAGTWRQDRVACCSAAATRPTQPMTALATMGAPIKNTATRRPPRHVAILSVRRRSGLPSRHSLRASRDVLNPGTPTPVAHSPHHDALRGAHVHRPNGVKSAQRPHSGAPRSVAEVAAWIRAYIGRETARGVIRIGHRQRVDRAARRAVPGAPARGPATGGQPGAAVAR